VIAFSPPPIIAVVVMLVSSRERTNALAFAAGWIVGIAVVGTIVLLLAGEAGASDDGEASTWVELLKLAIGVALVLLALRKWSGRPDAEDDVATPGWMATIRSLTPLRAGALGVVLSSVNPKNVLLLVAAAATEAQTGLSAGRQAIVWAIFVVIATLGVGTPVVLSVALGDRAAGVLDRLEQWLIRNATVVTAVLCLLIGVTLAGDAISGLAS
jgi:threonine/homoserine/homoserine lactone efflux protein